VTIRKFTFEFPLKCEVLKIVEERSPYLTLLTCSIIDEDGAERILLVARDGSIEKFDNALLEWLEKKYLEEPKNEEPAPKT